MVDYIRPAAELRALHKADNETAGRKLKLIALEPDGGADLAGVSGAVAIDDICALIEIYDEALLPYFENEVPANFYPGIFDGR